MKYVATVDGDRGKGMGDNLDIDTRRGSPTEMSVQDDFVDALQAVSFKIDLRNPQSSISHEVERTMVEARRPKTRANPMFSIRVAALLGKFEN